MRHLKLVHTRPATDGRPVLKLAFASTDQRGVNQPFVSSPVFVVCEIHPGGFQLSEMIAFAASGNLEASPDRALELRLQALQGCAAVYCSALDAVAIRRLLAVGIHPLRVDAGVPIGSLLRALLQAWQQQPPAWLRWALRRNRRRELGDDFEHRLRHEAWTVED